MKARSTRPHRQPKPQKRNQKPKQTDAEAIAALYIQASAALVRAGRALHDHVGSPLTAAGVQLQLLRMDLPEAGARIDDTLRVLEEALDRVRRLSQDLCPSPAYRGGLKQALLRIADQYESELCRVEVAYSATAAVPAEIAAAVHEAAAAAVEQALLQGAAIVKIEVRGAGRLAVRISDDGRKSGRVRALALAAMLARQQGLTFEHVTGKSTIVSICYGVRRAARG
ncbi:MAG TPA: histidine kinase [Bryobacteraceae bacterium]|jgi:signal transduction histidine kinase